VSTPSVPSRPSTTEQEDVRLSLSFQASSLREAASLAAELRTIGADAVRVHPSRPRLPGQRDWTVTLTTPPVPLTVAVVQLWEGEMLAVEHRWPGCHFLGWRTCQAPDASIGSLEREPDHDDAGARQRLSQRELVLASLLRRPAGERLGRVHGRGVPR
jgi:hypothetical protein